MSLDLPEPVMADGVLHATLLYVDSFGNIALNLTRDDVERLGVSVRLACRARADRRALLRGHGANFRGRPLRET